LIVVTLRFVDRFLVRAPRMTPLRLRVPLGAGRIIFMRDRSFVTSVRVIPMPFIAVGILARVRSLGWLCRLFGGLLLWSYTIGPVRI
jgi:hypothetical protein